MMAARPPPPASCHCDVRISPDVRGFPCKYGAVDFAHQYRAIAAKDARFDGQFFTAVRTTGIYCKPSCPARTPKPENVEFYSTSAAAQSAGYRACRRCLPEATPGSPEWNLREDAAARAIRLIADGVVDREGVGGLAARLGYSTRQLSRILHAEIGAGAEAIARASRAHTARELIVGTDLALADVAFASGFGSVRQFTDTIGRVYGMTPGQLRATRRDATVSRVAEVSVGKADASTSQAMTITLTLAHRAPCDGAGLLAWFGDRAVDGVEAVTSARYARSLLLPRGTATIDVRYDGESLRATVRLQDRSDLPVVIARLRRLLDLDADPVAVDEALAAEPALRASVGRTPGIRIPGSVDATEMLVRAIVGQQVTVASARTQLHRLAHELGEVLPVSVAIPELGITRLFPSAAHIAAHAGEVVRGPRARIEALRAACEGVANGDIVLDGADTRENMIGKLSSLKGVGMWTASYVALRVLNHPDITVPGDVALLRGAQRLGFANTAGELAANIGRLSPWRSYASLHLWRAATQPLPGENYRAKDES